MNRFACLRIGITYYEIYAHFLFSSIFPCAFFFVSVLIGSIVSQGRTVNIRGVLLRNSIYRTFAHWPSNSRFGMNIYAHFHILQQHRCDRPIGAQQAKMKYRKLTRSVQMKLKTKNHNGKFNYLVPLRGLEQYELQPMRVTLRRNEK